MLEPTYCHDTILIMQTVTTVLRALAVKLTCEPGVCNRALMLDYHIQKDLTLLDDEQTLLDCNIWTTFGFGNIFGA